MTVACHMAQCPYNDQRGFCANSFVAIDELGMCSVLWRKGQQRMIAISPDEVNKNKKPITIVEVAESELRSVQESENEGG